MAQDKIQMPQSGGGLIRYSDEVKSKIVMSPATVIILILVVIFIEVLLHTRGLGLFN